MRVRVGWINSSRGEVHRFTEIPRVLSPGNARTLLAVRFEPKMPLVSPSLLSPSKKKSFEVTIDVGLQGKPLTDVDLEALNNAKVL